MKNFCIIAFSVFSFFSIAQTNPISIHQQQLEEYNLSGNSDASFYENKPAIDQAPVEKTGCTLNKIVYGWHPYWVGSAYANYQWDLLSHFSFFSYEVNSADGQPISTHGWSTSAAVDAALNSGNTKVTLCVTLFSGHTTFFGSPTAQQTLIDNLINLIQSRGAHGVNIDFEGLPSSQTTNFANFMVSLSNQMHAAIPGSEVSTVLYAVDWNDVFDFSIMEPAVDHYIIMGYGYYYSGSSNAGPTDPLYHFGSTYNYTLSRSITYYLDKGCPANKLVLGLPSYGYEWETASTSIPSAAVGSGSARTYAVVKNNSSGNYDAANQQWVTDPATDVFVYNDGAINQCFISLDSAWRKRLDHINKTGIAGIGIWALGYDDGYTDLWEAMNDYLTDCFEDPCDGLIHDFGGPTKNYYNDENYTWTIQPPGATSIDVDFTLFDLELNYDYLYIYDGLDETAPQLAGSPFTGTNGPGQFTTTTGAVTFKFTSDVSTVEPGFLANYSCNSIPAPTAGFTIQNASICVGDSIQLVSTAADADTYSWTTSSGGLSSSTAESPYLFPSSSGNYSITQSVTNASGVDDVTQIIQITVNQPPVADGDVLNPNIVLPTDVANFLNWSTNATNYLWDFGDGGTSTEMSPWYQYTANGTYTVMLIASNAGCPADTMYLTINVGTQGLSEWQSNTISVFPNPASEFITVSLNGVIATEIQLIDMNGKLVKTIGVNGKMAKIDVSKFASGNYQVTILNEGKLVEKVMVVVE